MHREETTLLNNQKENLPGTGIDTKLGKPSAKVELDERTVLILDWLREFESK